MDLKIIKVGELQTNCYILKSGNDALVIDPGDEFYKIDRELTGLNVLGVIITHHHFDHVGALDDIVNKYNVKVYDRYSMKEGNNIIGPFSFEVIYVPGHTLDSVCIYFEKEDAMFVGDFIFKGSIGRTDIGGDDKLMRESLKKICKYKNVTIYPGHGDKTTLDYEKEHNYYINNIIK